MTFRYEWYKQYVNDFLKLTYDHYANFLPAVFVTYYKNIVNPIATEENVLKHYDTDSLAGYTDPAKKYSPNTFMKIMEVPVFLSETQTNTLEYSNSIHVNASNTFTIVMNSRNLIIPELDDYIYFPTTFNDGMFANKEPVFRIINIEPAIMTYKFALEQEYQTFKLTLLLTDTIPPIIDQKVNGTFLYLDKFNYLLPIEYAPLFIDTYKLFNRVEMYLSYNIQQITKCLTFNGYSFYDFTRLFIKLVNKNKKFSLYNVSNYVTLPIEAKSIFHYVLDDDETENLNMNNLQLVENLVTLPNKDVLLLYYRKRVYCFAEDGVDFFYLVYSNNATEIYNVLEHIANDKLNNTFTPILSSTILANIYNSKVIWENDKINGRIYNNWNNIFEALFIYKYCGDILWTLIN